METSTTTHEILHIFRRVLRPMARAGPTYTNIKMLLPLHRTLGHIIHSNMARPRPSTTGIQTIPKLAPLILAIKPTILQLITDQATHINRLTEAKMPLPFTQLLSLLSRLPDRISTTIVHPLKSAQILERRTQLGARRRIDSSLYPLPQLIHLHL